MSTRTETDGLGEIEVPNDVLWGAQTQRSLHYFSIGREIIPREMIEAYAIIKRACAVSNAESGRLSKKKKDLILVICDEIMSGMHDRMFPLHVWMTGSGTQFNMNINEVIANRASQIEGYKLGSKTPLHPNDDVNMAQSTNDTFPSAMHIASVIGVHRQLLPALTRLRNAMAKKSKQWEKIVKVGRTHLQDAVPITLGQEWYGYVGMLDEHIDRLEQARDALLPLALGGTALGTGVNTDEEFAERACAEITRLTKLKFTSGTNKFALQGAHDSLVHLSSCLRGLANSLFKIANDIRLLACGPRAGLGELTLPTNEPGSSIMPGKINPTQAEALTMLCLQVMSNDVAVGMGGASGMLDMNAYKPLIIHNIMQSMTLLHDGMNNFCKFLIEGIEANETHIKEALEHSLVLVTALSPAIGYDKASQVAHHAMEKGLSPRQSALDLGVMTAEDYDRIADPHLMLHPNITL
ncbi:class II fumarate hydratase [Saccharibacter sp. 17.LH.SD]|uniref:class II fumarate hydratase n=1 Tax=Saccharibacter sp. 17.LH.SD TaxID=2689393 RepID=UPI00136C1DC0|nr:class II fumarate hydratase [Saccharibacter sp. 17.LH.SD]MXV43945.1 class II fumarate hydratase [Saccharibacter sp. 17.LH.SD]